MRSCLCVLSHSQLPKHLVKLYLASVGFWKPNEIKVLAELFYA